MKKIAVILLLFSGCSFLPPIIYEAGSRVSVNTNLPVFTGRDGVVITNATQNVLFDVIKSGRYSQAFYNIRPGDVLFVPTGIWGQETLIITVRAYAYNGGKKAEILGVTSRTFYFSGSSYSYPQYWDVRNWDIQR